MAEDRTQHRDDLNLEKLGIRQIHERIEVSPILTDVASLDSTATDGGPKSYICTINFPGSPVEPLN